MTMTHLATQNKNGGKSQDPALGLRGRSSSPRDIIPELKNYLITTGHAIRQLSISSSPKGLLYAGGLAVDVSSRSSGKDKADDYLVYAEHLFNRSDSTSRSLYRTETSGTQVRARTLKAMLAMHWLFNAGYLPTAEVSEGVYRSVVSEALGLLDVAFDKKYSERYQKNARGVIAELAVFSLLSRDSQQKTGDEVYFPILSTPSQSQVNTAGSTVDHNWDMAIFTPGSDNLPGLTYRLQVKSHDDSQHQHGRKWEGDKVGSNKLKKANELNIKQINEDQFLELIK